VIGDSVLTVTRNTQRRSPQDPYRLLCLDGRTGTQRWSSESSGMGTWSFAGEPLLVEGTLYAVAQRQSTTEAHVLAIDPSNGRLQWSVMLGTMTAQGNRYSGAAGFGVPSLVESGGMVYVLTNNGAVVAVNAVSRTVEWAFTHETKQVPNEMFWSPYRSSAATIETRGRVLVQDGVLYAKETGGSAIYAIDLGGPTLKWARPVASEDMIAGIGDGRMYLLGLDLSAMDLDSRRLLWSVRTPVQTGALRPILDGGHGYVLSSRGVYQVELADGDVVRLFRGGDSDSLGGTLWASGERLVCVSNLRITAYPLAKGSSTRPGGAEPIAETSGGAERPRGTLGAAAPGD
jgi:outer membrane protein assembly factor BamB